MDMLLNANGGARGRAEEAGFLWPGPRDFVHTLHALRRAASL